LRSEELRTYLFTIVAAIAIIFITLVGRFDDFPQQYTLEECFRHSYFQVASILTTAGFSTTDFNLWPMTATTTLVVLMFVGGMAGSTAGGLKTSRIVIAVKGAYIYIRKLINPRYVPKAKFEGKLLEQKTIQDVFAYITIYCLIFVSALFLLSFDPINGEIVQIVSDGGPYEVRHGFFSNFSTVLACICNIGPAFEAVGPYASYLAFSPFSKIILMATMLIGRLEILPVLILFSPKTWKKI
jgi:trk system potassium uptake protein TrkH